jgi:hypothetical protein
MRIAYADPPYMGCADKYPEKQEVDHLELVRQLVTFDGWALSASSVSLPQLIPIVNEVTSDYRIGAWVKSFASFKPNVNPAYAWEPVIFRTARGYTREDLTVRDWCKVGITLQRGLVGAKPPEFCYWLFRILNLQPEDEFVDLYPGTGAVSRAWQETQQQGVIV